MNRILRTTLALLVCTSAVLCAQDGAPRKKGTIYKGEVDSLINVVRSSALAAGMEALGADACTTAKLLTAMAHCHRHYHISDGPVVRPSIAFLFKARAADGSFGDANTTAWVVEALQSINPDGYREEVAKARAWLEARQTDEVLDGFDARVSQVLDKVRADVFPEQLGAEAAQRARGWFEGGVALDRAQAAETLLQLVACQAANRKLDAAQDPAATAAVWSPAQAKAFDWLMQQQKDGVFSVSMGGKSFPDPAFTGFGLMALQGKPKAQRTKEEQAVIDAGLRWLLTQQNEDGTFGKQVLNYTTCVVVGALSRWDDPAVAPALQKAQKAILAFQNSEAGGYQRSDRDYGSIGYGGAQRGDLSNLHFSLEALRATGLPPDNEAFQKALVFLQRTQNLKSVNDFSGKLPDPDREGVILDATSGDDGGASYYPGNSAAGYVVLPDGKSVARSYGSMTYALLKSYTLAGVKGNDPRVVAAVDWIRRNWTLAINPGADPALGEKVKYQGLFYYYLVLAQALDAAGIKTIRKVEVNDGVEKSTEVDWRKELRAHLEAMQRPDGTWINSKNGRWMESLDLLCTCYAMGALEHCR
ncbi:MAG: terpene cyclase/mutase family protein [Planctomycetes bacterium]|nr:terpene cyclase/mutase family protein [Planctomycetota bacterium]MCB9887498.1 terpene cyclase/mutase family protein [Planctomycetota bacterium]